MTKTTIKLIIIFTTRSSTPAIGGVWNDLMPKLTHNQIKLVVKAK
jgi:hypothetical protein